MSGKTGIIIQARMSSSRLPGKSMMLIGKHPLIWYVVKRAEILDLPVVVCTSTDPTDDVLCDFLNQEGISYFRGDLHNVLDRYIKTAEEFNIENIVRVTGDNPLFDFEYLRHNINLFNSYDYVDGIYEGGLIKGSGFELVKLEELINIKNPNKDHEEHVTLALRQALAKNPSYVQLQTQENDVLRDEIYLTCDFPEDLELLKRIFENFDYRVDVRIEEVINYIQGNPNLKNINKFLH
ncbi:MAG: cytidylyltransferase domain-containing protein [Bacteroidota bacterium]